MGEHGALGKGFESSSRSRYNVVIISVEGDAMSTYVYTKPCRLKPWLTVVVHCGTIRNIVLSRLVLANYLFRPRFLYCLPIFFHPCLLSCPLVVLLINYAILFAAGCIINHLKGNDFTMAPSLLIVISFPDSRLTKPPV